MERFTVTFDALLAALADAVKQLGEGNQQRWARTRVEEAKQDFIACCDIMCFQLKQAVEMIRQEMLQAVSASNPQLNAAWDAEQVRQVLEAAERFAAQLGEGAAAEAGAGGGPAPDGFGTYMEEGDQGAGWGAGPQAPAGPAAIPPYHQQQQQLLQNPYGMNTGT